MVIEEIHQYAESHQENTAQFVLVISGMFRFLSL